MQRRGCMLGPEGPALARSLNWRLVACMRVCRQLFWQHRDACAGVCARGPRAGGGAVQTAPALPWGAGLAGVHAARSQHPLLRPGPSRMQGGSQRTATAAALWLRSITHHHRALESLCRARAMHGHVAVHNDIASLRQPALHGACIMHAGRGHLQVSCMSSVACTRVCSATTQGVRAAAGALCGGGHRGRRASGAPAFLSPGRPHARQSRRRADAALGQLQHPTQRAPRVPHLPARAAASTTP